MQDLKNVTRFELITGPKRAVSLYGLSELSLSVQDEGRTLKVFASESEEQAAAYIKRQRGLQDVLMAARGIRSNSDWEAELIEGIIEFDDAQDQLRKLHPRWPLFQ